MPAGVGPASRRQRGAPGLTARRAWIATVVALVAVAAVVILWARTRPGYDPYGWLVWGYQTLHLRLNLGGAPSWKPLPYVFTVPFAVAGHGELWLWMLTAVTSSLAGAVFAGRIAFRITGGAAALSDPSVHRRCAPVAAAVFAGAAVLGIEGYMHYVLSAQSDPVIVTCCLAAVDMHLCGHHRWSFALGVLGALGRPEVWPFLGVYTIWAWIRVPSMRWLLVAGIALIAFMWFGIPWITNGRPDIAGQLALKSPRELHQGKITGTIGRFTELQYLPVMLAALAGVAFGALRRDRVVLTLAAAVVLWVVVEIAFALHGFPALQRYMFEAAGFVAVLAGVGVGWLISELPRLRPGLPRSAGVAVVVVLVAALVPGAVSRIRAERLDLKHERARTHQIQLLATTIDSVGGYQHIRACGEPVTGVEYASVLAWLTRLNVGHIGYRPGHEKRRRYPIVLILPLPGGGWSVQPWHTRRAQRSECRDLRAAYVVTPRDPSGVLVRG
ncbi:MAG: hypothetical protein ACLP50_22185 [Solirubrobacteraceae bacterium]